VSCSLSKVLFKKLKSPIASPLVTVTLGHNVPWDFVEVQITPLGTVMPVKISGEVTSTAVVVTDFKRVAAFCGFHNFDSHCGFGNIRRCRAGDLAIVCPPLTLTHVSKVMGRAGWREESLRARFAVAIVPSAVAGRVHFHSRYPGSPDAAAWVVRPAYMNPRTYITMAVREAILHRRTLEATPGTLLPCITDQVAAAAQGWAVEEVLPAPPRLPPKRKKGQGWGERFGSPAQQIAFHRQRVEGNCRPDSGALRGLADRLRRRGPNSKPDPAAELQAREPWWKGLEDVDTDASSGSDGGEGSDSDYQAESE
jgi:hypothetical protein